ncbi:hypothetical protein D3C72_2254880 [compost metagenome]
MQEVDEQGQTQQAVNNRRHGGEVVDVDLDDRGEAVARRVFFQPDGGADADRNGDQGRDQQHQGRTDHGAQQARQLGLGRVALGEQGAVEVGAN